MKPRIFIMFVVGLSIIAIFVSCTDEAASEKDVTSSLLVPTVNSQQVPTRMLEKETPVFSEIAPTPLTTVLSKATDAVQLAPTATRLFVLDDMAILYTTIQMVEPDIMVTRTVSPIKAPPEMTPESVGFSNEPIDYWTLKILSDRWDIEQPIFDRFYGEARQSEDIAHYFLNFRPQISPNGRYILMPGIGGYTNPNGDLGTGLWLADLQGGRIRQLLPQAKIATWSPQSDQITYVEGDTVYILSIDQGAKAIPLFTHPNLNWLYARWSPDGEWIAVVSKLDGSTVATLWLIPVHGNGKAPQELINFEHSLIEHVADEITWSYDSQLLLIRDEIFDLEGEKLSNEFPGQVNWFPNQLLLLINGDNGLQIATVDGEVSATLGNAFSSAWAFSHNGQQLAYSQVTNNEQVDVFIFDMETQINQLIGSVPVNYLNLIRWGNGDQYLIMDDGLDETPIWRIDSKPGSLPEEISNNGVLIEVVVWP